MVAIPKIIHQIWIQGYGQMPLRYRCQAKTWQKRNPSWEYRLWDGDSLQTLIRNCYHELLPVYEAYDSVIARADVGRYILLDAFGGVYVDTDTVCIRSINQYLVQPNVSLYVQVYDNPVCPAVPDQLTKGVSNAFIACPPAHQFWRYVFRHLRESEHPQHSWILATGPEMFVECLEQYLGEHDDVHFFTRNNIITAYYISRHYLRWYAWKNRDVFAIHHNDTGRSDWRPSIRNWLWPSA